MSNLLKTILSALRRWDAKELQVPERVTESDSRYVASPLPRHRVSLAATASFGISGIPAEILIRDINEKGLYFYTGWDMPVGSSIDILAVLPPEVNGNHEARRVHYEAKVVRVERERGKEQYGVGVAIRRCETFPLPTTNGPRKPAAAPKEVLVSAPESVQQSKTAQENIQPAPTTTTPFRIPKIAEPVKEIPAPAPIQKIAAPIEETTAPVVEIRASAVIGDSETSNRQVTNQNRRAIVERLAAAALRAGISIEELIRLIDSGISPTELVDIIEARLTARIG